MFVIYSVTATCLFVEFWRVIIRKVKKVSAFQELILFKVKLFLTFYYFLLYRRHVYSAAEAKQYSLSQLGQLGFSAINFRYFQRQC